MLLASLEGSKGILLPAGSFSALLARFLARFFHEFLIAAREASTFPPRFSVLSRWETVR
jgi:hypothetical protein